MSNDVPAEQRLAEVGEAAAFLAAAREDVRQWEATLRDRMRVAVDAGCPSAEVARVAGVSRARVSQVAPSKKTVQTRAQAGKKRVRAVRVNDPDTVPVLPDTTGGTLAGVVSQRSRKRYGKETVFFDTRESTDVAVILRHAASVGATRVMLTGPTPLDTSTGATMAEAVRAWALTDPGPGWVSGEHYLADEAKPVLRFRPEGGGAQVTIHRAAAWWGETDAHVDVCRAAWAGLGKVLDQVPAFAGAGLADTPATTGRALWLRTIPEGRSFPVLSDELRELIAATSGQGRIELLPDPGKAAPREGFTYVDGRLMYAALTWGMPVGEPTMWTGSAFDRLDTGDAERTLRGRGRWRVTVTVPAGWAHLGLIGVREGMSTTVYPRTPGQMFTTWADGAEVWLARSQGWHVIVHEGMTWAEGKPLDAWRDALVGVWKSCQASDSPAAALAAKAVRMILLTSLGAFASRTHQITRTAPLDGQVPDGVEVRRVGDRLVWSEPAAQSDWTKQTAHPEWSATVWARARVRLLTARVGQETVGALHLPFDRIVGMRTDALYLAGGAPGWPDDGEPGRFRVKGHTPGPFTWPKTDTDLNALRDAAESE